MKRTTLLLLVCTLVFASCDLAKLNENVKDPTDIPADPLFTSAQVSLGTFLHNPDVNVHDYMYLAQHWTATTYVGEPQYELQDRDVPSNIWQTFYTDVLVDLQEANKLIQANEGVSPEVKKNKLASIEVLQVYSYWHLVTLFGNVPFKEALNPDITHPNFNEARTVYKSIIDSLNTAISNFTPGAEGFGNADIYYDGNISKWIKFANSLKLRMGMMLAEVDPTRAQQIVEAAVTGGVFTSNADNAMIPFTAVPPTTNPVWENVIQSGRDDYVPAKPFINHMNEVNDPRRAVFFTQVNGKYIGGNYALGNDYADFSHFAQPLIEPGRDGIIMGYPEVEFLLAEAAQRGYAVPGTAAGHYLKAITADMNFWGVPKAEITAYLAQPEVAYNAATWRKSIGLQKWFALWGQWYQAWTSFRRLDYPNLNQNVPEEAATDIVPVRYFYPVTEYRFNGEQVKQAAQAIGGDTFVNKLFWDVR